MPEHNHITPIRRSAPPIDLPRYSLFANGREVDMPCGSYVGALVYARCEALRDTGVQYKVKRDNEEIARYTACAGKIVEAWVR